MPLIFGTMITNERECTSIYRSKRVLTKSLPRYFGGRIAGRRVNDAIVDCLKKMLFVQFQILAQRFGETFSINIWVTSA